jgi:hypothetical protein
MNSYGERNSNLTEESPNNQHLKVLSQPYHIRSHDSGFNIDQNLDVNQCVELCLITQNLSFVAETLGNRDLFREITPINIGKMISFIHSQLSN